MTSASAVAAPAFFKGGLGANDRIRVAIVGIRGRGFSLARSLLQMSGDNVEVAALCDVDAKALAQRSAAIEKLNGGKRVPSVGDMRRLLDDPSVDAIIHATPTHWHALGGIWTLQAGKDAYIEKPLALTLWEGRKLIEAASRYKRIVQHGTQCRSSPEILEAVARLKEGVIGQVVAARGIGHKYRPGIGKLKPETPPSTLNYDLWRGPAPMKPYSENQVHYNWHWFWDTGNGDLGNLGVHGLDVVRLALDLTDYPEKVQSMGAKLIFDDAKETPNFQTSVFRYRGRSAFIEYSIRNGFSNSEGGIGETIPFTLGDRRDAHSLIFYGSEGFMLIPDYISYHTFLGRDRKPGPKRVGSGPPDANIPHLRNFLAAVRSRNSSVLNAGVEEGARSTALCHLANIAYRVGRTLAIDPRSGSILGDEEAVQLTTRAYRAPYVVPD